MEAINAERSDFETEFQLPETAARRPNVGTKFTSPMEMVKKNLYGIVLNANALFRLGIMGSLLNDQMNEEFSTIDMSNVIGFDLSPYAQPITADRLRETAMVKPGNGKSKPISIEFTESLFNIGGEIVERIMKLYPEGIDKGITLSAFFQHIYNMNISGTVMTALTPSLDTFKDTYLDPLDDFVEFKIKIVTPEYSESTHTVNLDFTLSIELEADIYPEVIDSEEFSAYLVYLWVYNSLRLTKNRLNKIVDPRKVSAHKNSMLKLGPIRPKVNKSGFAIHGSGNPIFIPPTRDIMEQFIKTANSCIDEDGVFRRDFLVDEHKLGDAIIYVDWVNDILAYTTSTGILSTYNLGDVAPFDPVTEYNFLSTPLKSNYLMPITTILTESFKDIEGENAAKFTTNEEVKRILRDLPAVRIYTNIVNATNASDAIDACLYHVCGGQLDELEDTPGLIELVMALKCLIKYLNELRKSDKEALKLPSSMRSQGIIHRLIGVEYVLRAIDKYDDKVIETYRQAWRTETAKFKSDPSVRTFDIPNIKVGKGGLTGLLPHQGRILSSAIKSPQQSIKSVSTGGGKTIISIVQSIFGIVNTKTIPMILTKANLIRGTITEINQICKGEINAIPFTPITLRRMARISGIDTFAKLLKWYQTLPKNTILVGSYSSLASRRKLYSDLDIVDGFCEFSVPTTQFMLIIKLLGIRFVSGDESHMIKNPESARSRNSYAIFSHADNRDVMSGTIVSNTVPDLVGQSRAISPYIFGDDPVAFADRYGLSAGLIKSDADAKKIKDRLKATVAYHEANEEDWAYMLPAMDDEIMFANMTPLQHEFYNLLMQEAELMLIELEKSKKKIKAEEDDDEEDEEDDDEGDNADGDDEEEARIVAAAKVHLQKVEMFLVAPDSNEQYMQWERKPSGEDLVSPKVREADKLIEAHVLKHRDDLPNNKVIVFGWNIVSAEHFMRHSKFASKSLHYTAGNEEVIRQFETNPTNIILCATEGSVREGLNLQMTSLICRLQSVWSPGEHKQVRARMYRPDPRGKYNRDSVRHVWIMTRLPNNQPTLDGVKIARLVSKYVSNARLTYEGRMEWRRVSAEFDELKMLKMNLQLIFHSRDYDLEPYFQAWKTYVNWEKDLNKQAKRRMAEKLEQENDVDLLDDKGNITDINKFIQLAMYGVESTYKIPGSKRVYVPFIRNALPADPNNYGFSVLGNNDIPVGTVIYTEFGPAVVKASMKKAVKVQLYNGRTVSLKKGTVHVAAPSKYKEFAKVVKDPVKWRNESFDPHGVKGLAKVEKTKIKDEEEVIEALEDNLESEDMDEVEIFAGMLNSWPALIIDEDINELKNLEGWNRIDPFTSITFRSWAAAEKLIELLDSKMHISDKVYDALMEEMEEIREGKAMRLTKQINPQKFRNFFLDQKKRLGRTKNGKVIVNPYWIVNDEKVLLAFDTNSHDPNFISWLNRNRAKFPGVVKITKNDAMWINIFKSVREAMQDLKNLTKIRSIDVEQIKRDLVDVKDEILKLKRPRSRPNM